MTSANRSNDKRILDQRLVREARTDRPEFSEALHARICLAVRERAGEGPGRATASPRRKFTRAVSLAVTAACVLVVSLIAWRALVYIPGTSTPGNSNLDTGQVVLNPPPAPAMEDPNSPDDLASVDDLADGAVQQMGTLLDSAVASQQWADLDHDARLAVESLAAHWPFPPSGD